MPKTEELNNSQNKENANNDWFKKPQKSSEEKKWKGTGSSSSFRSQQLENRSKREKHLDMLARLFTNHKKGKKDTCVGVCYHEGKLFISSNEKEPKYAKEYMEKLQKFANNQTSDSYEELLNLSIRQICCIEPENIERVGNTELLNKFQTIAKDYNAKISLRQKPSWESLPKVAGKLFLEVKKADEESTEESQKWKCLTHWHDTRKIAKAIIKKNIDNKSIDDDILKVIEMNKVEYINGRHINSNEKGKLKLHAEMGMMENLISNERVIQYIGLTKLSCDDCYAVIKLNSKLFNDSEREVCGRHGKEYSNWLIPNFMKERKEEIKEWGGKEENQVKERILETTSKVSEKETLSNPVVLLEELQFQEWMTQAYENLFKQPPK